MKSKYRWALRIAIKKKGHTYHSVSVAAGINKSRMSRLVTGQFNPRKKELQVLSKLLGLSQRDLFPDCFGN